MTFSIIQLNYLINNTLHRYQQIIRNSQFINILSLMFINVNNFFHIVPS